MTVPTSATPDAPAMPGASPARAAPRPGPAVESALPPAAPPSEGAAVKPVMPGPGSRAGSSVACVRNAIRGVRLGRVVRWWGAASPWLMAGILGLALYLGYFAYGLLQIRLHDSSRRFDEAMHRFEHYWVLYDASLESTLALKWDLAAAAPPQDPAAFRAVVARFQHDAAALHAEITQPGILLLSQAGAYDAAVAHLDGSLAAAGPEPVLEAGPRAASLGVARGQTQAVLDRLSAVGQEARQRQSLAAAFRDEVDAVRRQVLFAFCGIVAMLVLVVGVAVQWVVVAQRERASRDRAEHLAAVAEAERSRAENVMRDKSRFLGMLSHELLTPLQSIWSTMDVIESRGRVDVHEPTFTRLRDSTRSLRGRISDLVDFAKMSSGRLETRIRGFQLDKLIDAALRGVEEELAARNLDVHWEAGADLSERIYSDPARLRQIIDNLVTNAVKYTERGGITINAQVDRGGGILRIEIADTGVGIRQEEMGRLFEPFYRVPATAGMAEGSGLGLAVVRSLVDLMGGSIRIGSEVGQGTTVTLEVPIAEAVDGIVDVPLRLDLPYPVLVVDDSRDARRAMADVIRALGIEAYEAAGGTAGLAEAGERDYLAIILDMQMPDLSGYEVALRLRRPGGRNEKTFLILVSAYSDLDDEAADAVFDARIDKPASRHDLVAVLARAAQSRPA